MKSKILNYLVEILIIIIGIIIAFYLTKYGERINRNQNEKDIINQIYFELESNLTDLEQDFVLHNLGLMSNLRAIKFLNTGGEVSDSLIMDFYWMTRDEYIFASTSGYENLKSFGTNLIRDDTLRKLITTVYNHDFPRLSKGNTLNPDINEYLTPFFKKHFRINRDTSLKYSISINDSLKVTFPIKTRLGVHQMIGYIPLDKEALLKNEEFRFLISKSLEYRMYKYSAYRNTIRDVKNTMKRLKKEL